MESDGPGAILWIWVAANIEIFAGNIRIYFDHSERPVLDMKMDDLLGGDRPRNYFLSSNLWRDILKHLCGDLLADDFSPVCYAEQSRRVHRAWRTLSSPPQFAAPWRV